ncbi:MAG: hypothetical protein ABEH56_06180 [Salinirussus sp.]
MARRDGNRISNTSRGIDPASGQPGLSEAPGGEFESDDIGVGSPLKRTLRRSAYLFVLAAVLLAGLFVLVSLGTGAEIPVVSDIAGRISGLVPGGGALPV